MDWGIVGGITGIVSLALIVFAGGRYIGVLDTLKKRHETCPILAVDKEIAILKARFDMFLTTIETNVPPSLIAPHSPHRDDLLLKMSKREMNRAEAKELLADLENNRSEFSPDKALAVVLVIVRLKDMVNGWS